MQPLGWNNGQGLHWEPLRGRFSWLRSTEPTDDGLYKMYYKDLKKHHYPTLMSDIEAFERDFETFKSYTLAQGLDLEQQIRTFTDLPESAVPTDSEWYSAGNLALFAFNRIWMREYSAVLTVRPVPLSPQGLWQIIDIGISTDYAHGSETAVRKLHEHVDAVMRDQDKESFNQAANELADWVASILDALAELRASVRLEGDCDATR
jgi:hypothetical protein